MVRWEKLLLWRILVDKIEPYFCQPNLSDFYPFVAMIPKPQFGVTASLLERPNCCHTLSARMIKFSAKTALPTDLG